MSCCDDNKSDVERSRRSALCNEERIEVTGRNSGASLSGTLESTNEPEREVFQRASPPLFFGLEVNSGRIGELRIYMAGTGEREASTVRLIHLFQGVSAGNYHALCRRARLAAF